MLSPELDALSGKRTSGLEEAASGYRVAGTSREELRSLEPLPWGVLFPGKWDSWARASFPAWPGVCREAKTLKLGTKSKVISTPPTPRG